MLPDNNPTYCKCPINPYVLGEDDHYPRLRTSINNILVWGASVRKGYNKGVLVDIWKRVPKPKTSKSFKVSTEASMKERSPLQRQYQEMTSLEHMDEIGEDASICTKF